MDTQRGSKWWGLYALVPLMIGLMVLDAVAPVSDGWHRAGLAGIALLICGLAARWVERHPRLVERSGIDSGVAYHLSTGSGVTYSVRFDREASRLTAQSTMRSSDGPPRHRSAPALREESAEVRSK
jgi:hypothetical protein